MSLVDSGWLSRHLDDPSVRVCDVRWYLPSSGKRGADEYAKGHVPGAVFVDLDAWLAAPDDGSAGRHPMPDPRVFAEGLARAGIGPGTHVVAYDDAGGAVASRLWWLLRASGHRSVSLLDGGLPAWVRAGGELSTAPVQVAPVAVHVTAFDPSAIASLEDVRTAVQAGALLLDARAPERYRGDVEPVDPRAGHIPGATNLPTARLVESGAFLPVESLRAAFTGAGVVPGRDVVSSCGSGVTACHLLFALDLAGLRPFGSARLYVGSFSEWSRRRELPVATGSEPGVLP